MSKTFSLNPPAAKHSFRRKQVGKQVPSESNLTKNLDNYIQKALTFFKYTEKPKNLVESTGEFSKLLLTSQPEIPDLVIYNSSFNKNDCFVEGVHCSEPNLFPRIKFEVKEAPLAQKPDPQTFLRGNSSRPTDNQYDDEEVEWEDVDAKELKNVQIKFQKLPGLEDNKEVLVLKEEEVSKVINVNSLFGSSIPVYDSIPKTEDLFSSIEKEKENTDVFVNFKKPNSSQNLINLENIEPLKQTRGNNNQSSTNINFHPFNDQLFEDLSLINRNIPSKPDESKKLPFFNEGYDEFQSKRIPEEFIDPRQFPSNDKRNPNFQQQKMNPNFVNGNPNYNMEMNMNFGKNMNMNYNPFLNNMPQVPGNFMFPNQMPFNMPPNNYHQGNGNYSNNHPPESFLEDPLSVVMRNVNLKGWYIKENDAILAVLNSYELLLFLDLRLKNKGSGMGNLWINDMSSDIYYTPDTLYDILLENKDLILPKTIRSNNQMNQGGRGFRMGPNMKSNFIPPEEMFQPRDMFYNQQQFPQNFQMMGGYPGQYPNSMPPMKPNQYQQPVNVNMNINLMQGEVNVSNLFGSQNNNIGMTNNNQLIYQNMNDNVFMSNFNNIYNTAKNTPSMKKNTEKKK